MAQKIQFRHSGILTSLGGAANTAGLFSPSNTTASSADTGEALDSAQSAADSNNDTVAQGFRNSTTATPPPQLGYDGHPLKAALDYIFNAGRGHAAANSANFGLQSAQYLTQQQQAGMLANDIARRNYELQTNPTLLQQGNDATQALASAQRTGADNRLQTTLDRLQQYNFSGNANGAAPLRSTRENPYTTATDLDTLYGQPEINSIGLNRSRALSEAADNSSIASLAQRPYIPSIATSQAGADIYGNMFRAAQGQYGNALTTAKLPNAPLEGQSQQLAAITGNNLEATKSGQTTAYLQDNPSFVGQGMQSGQDELRARIAAMSRSILPAGALEVGWNNKNQATGSVLNPAPINPMLGGQFAPQYRALQTTGTATPTFSVDEVNQHINGGGTNSAPNPAITVPSTTATPAPQQGPQPYNRSNMFNMPRVPTAPNVQTGNPNGLSTEDLIRVLMQYRQQQ